MNKLDVYIVVRSSLKMIPRDVRGLIVRLLTDDDVILLSRALGIMCEIPTGMVSSAARFGYINVLKWLYDNPRWSEFHIANKKACDAAAVGGCIETIKWLIKHNFRLFPFVITTAVENNQFKMVKYLYQYDSTIRNVRMDWEIGAAGNIEMMEWLIDTKYEINLYDISLAAARRGHLHMLIHLYQNFPNFEFIDELFNNAIRHAHWNVIEWLSEHNCPMHIKLTRTAAFWGHIKILQWLHVHGCYSDEYTMANAACNDHLDIVQWLHQNGCPFSPKACEWASENGHLHIIKYLHENGCPWSPHVIYWAKYTKRTDILEYALANGCPN